MKGTAVLPSGWIRCVRLGACILVSDEAVLSAGYVAASSSLKVIVLISRMKYESPSKLSGTRAVLSEW